MLPSNFFPLNQKVLNVTYGETPRENDSSRADKKTQNPLSRMGTAERLETLPKYAPTGVQEFEGGHLGSTFTCRP